MRFVIFVVILLSIAFFTGVYLTLIYPRYVAPAQAPVTREFTPEGLSAVPTGTITATILGSISISGDIPVSSTINVEARKAGTQQFSTVVQNLPAKQNQTFSYTKATNGSSYDMQITLLDPTSKVIGTSQIITVTAPSLNSQFKVSSSVATSSLTPTPTSLMPTGISPNLVTPTVTPTPTPASASSTLSGVISFHGAAPVNSRIVIFQELANASPYHVAVDNIIPVDRSAWLWDSAISGNSYSVIAILKQKQGDGSDKDITTSAPVTVTAPAGAIELTINANYTPTKPAGTSSVNCTTYNGGPNQNTWNVTVSFPSYTGGISYWLEIGTTDGQSDIVNTYGSTRSVSTVFKNNTAYFARYAYAAVPDVNPGSGQYSVFSDSTQLMCSK